MFTLPHELNPIVQGNPALIYRLLFHAASKTLLEFGRNPRWLGGELGITMVLHTWGQNLGQHIHVHCVVTDGALSPNGERWLTPPRRGSLFPTAALSKVFRGKYLDALTDAHRCGELRMSGDDDRDDIRAFESLKTSLQSSDWVVYTKAPFAGASNVLAYLACFVIRAGERSSRSPYARPSGPEIAEAERDRIERADADWIIVLRAGDQQPLPVVELERLESAIDRVDEPQVGHAFPRVDRALHV